MLRETEKTIYRIVLLILVIAVVWLGYCVYAHKKAAPETYQVEKAEELAFPAENIETVPAEIENKYIGYVRAQNQVDVIPYINGFVEKIFVKNGQQVKAGEPLLQIRPDEYIARLEAARAAVAQADASYNNVKIYYERIKKAGTKAVSPTETDDARAALLEAYAAHKQAKADMMLAQVNLSYTLICASIDGLVGYVDLSVGDYVAPAKSLFSIVQTNPTRVVFSIPDKDYLEEKSGKKMFENDDIKLVLTNGNTYPYTGNFAFADNKTNRSTGSVAVYADFKNPDNLLLDGSYVDVNVVKTIKDAVYIQKGLVQMKEDGDFVYVIRDGRLALQQVEILGSSGGKYIIRGNFLPTDKILKELVQSVALGTKVRAAEEKDMTSPEEK